MNVADSEDDDDADLDDEDDDDDILTVRDLTRLASDVELYRRVMRSFGTDQSADVCTGRYEVTHVRRLQQRGEVLTFAGRGLCTQWEGDIS